MGSRRCASRRTNVTLVAVAGLHAALFLLLGPCYVTPPDGFLTIEAHIQNPDKVVKGKD